MPKRAKTKKTPSVVQKQTVKQSVRVVVQQAPTEKKRRRARAKAPQQQVERYIAHPGFAASQIISSPSFFNHGPFDVSVLAQAQLNQMEKRGGGLDTSVQHIKELAGPKFEQSLLPDTPRVHNIPILPFPELSAPPKEPRARQPTEASAAKARLRDDYQAKYNKPPPKSWSAEKIRQML